MKPLRSLLFILLGLNLFACNAQQDSSDGKTALIKDIHAAEAKGLLDNDKDIIIVDVRTPREFEAGHIQGAKNINVADKDFRSNIENLDRDSTYLVYCQVGNRSKYAVNVMKELDFKTIYHLNNGISEWIREGNPVEK